MAASPAAFAHTARARLVPRPIKTCASPPAQPQRLDFRAGRDLSPGHRRNRCQCHPTLDTTNQLENHHLREQMMDAYASVGMPVLYRHWSYGMKFIATEQQYRRGQMGLIKKSSSIPTPASPT